MPSNVCAEVTGCAQAVPGGTWGVWQGFGCLVPSCCCVKPCCLLASPGAAFIPPPEAGGTEAGCTKSNLKLIFPFCIMS